MLMYILTMIQSTEENIKLGSNKKKRTVFVPEKKQAPKKFFFASLNSVSDSVKKKSIKGDEK